MGVRLDGVSNAKLSNIEIYNMIQETDLGSTLCGEYTGFEPNSAAFVGGHITQSSPMQVGFSGNMVQGISLNAADGVVMNDIYIKGLDSHSGDAIAISVWPSVNAVLTGNVLIDEITAGSQLEEQKGVLSWESRPNRAPMACGILSTEKFYSKDTATTYMSSVEVNKDQRADMKVESTNIHGFAYCDGSHTEPLTKTMVGQYLYADSASEEEQEIEAIINGDDSGSGESVEAGDALDDNSLVAEPETKEDIWMNTEHYLLNAVIAAAIFCCFCVIIGYVAFLYCRHQKKQKETEQQAKIFMQRALNEGGALWHERINRRKLG